MYRGYVKLWRKVLDEGWIKNHKLWVFWTYCLLKATHKEYNATVGYQIESLLPGQFIAGLRKASEETGLTISEIRTILKFLQRNECLTIKTTNKYSIFTLVNWNKYQSKEADDDRKKNKQGTNE